MTENYEYKKIYAVNEVDENFYKFISERIKPSLWQRLKWAFAKRWDAILIALMFNKPGESDGWND